MGEVSKAAPGVHSERVGNGDAPTVSPHSEIDVASGEAGGEQLKTTTRPALTQTVSKIRRDAESYGIKWKPPKQFTFATPIQVKEKHTKWLKLLGRVGWTAKAIVYALIGGLACKNGVQDDGSNASPQGAFVLIGTANGGKALLVILAMAIGTYAAWRFWEGAVGQGYDDTFSNTKNFFKFRLSPAVSGGVYVAYMIFVIEVIPRDDEGQQAFASNSTWPNSWHDSTIGKVGLVIVGLAFLAATIVQLEQFFTKSFHNTIRDSFPYMPQRFWKAFRIFVLTTGHLGVLGRAGIFLFAAVLFFRTIKDKNDYNQSAFGAAFAQLQSSRAGRAFLFIIGFLVVVYALFALLNVYARYFPTPPPSRKAKVKHYSHTGGEAPLTPQFRPDDDTGFHPLSGPGAAQQQKPNIFTPMSNAVGKDASKRQMQAAARSEGHADVEMGVAEVRADGT